MARDLWQPLKTDSILQGSDADNFLDQHAATAAASK
jgi:hypothetical protein